MNAKYRKRNITRTAILLFILITLIFSFLFLNNKQQVNAKKSYLDQNTILSVIKILENEYYSDLNIKALINGAVSGINNYCRKKLLFKTDAIKPSSEEDNERTAVIYFKEQYKNLVDNVINKKSEYSSKFDESLMVYSSVDTMLEVLYKKPYEDPYTVLLTPKEYKIFEESMTGGNFCGIGIYLEQDRKNNMQLTVSEPIEGTPAYKAGLKPGDRIMKIDNLATKGLDIDVAVSKIRGPAGTKVLLNINRGKSPNVNNLNIEIVRAKIHVKSAVSKFINDDIGYIQLRNFAQDTKKEFDQCLATLNNRNMKALIIDLRNNGGGYINSAVDVCSRFMPRGTVIVAVVNYRKQTRETERSYGDDVLDIPVAILINKYSASASEIVAGAFQDTKRGILVGEKSYGEGSVQTMDPLPDGGALKYTIAIYLTPNGRNLNKKGIEPDIESKMELENIRTENDSQMKKAVDVLKSRISGNN